MPSRARALILCGSLLGLLASCKERNDAGRPLPPPEPPATAAAAPPREPISTKKRPSSDGAEAASPKPKRADETAPAPAAAAPEATATTSAATAGAGSVSADASTPNATGGAPAVPPATGTVPLLPSPSAACLARCQSAMQGCLAQPVDGGVPGFGNLELCKKALDACQAACQ